MCRTGCSIFFLVLAFASCMWGIQERDAIQSCLVSLWTISLPRFATRLMRLTPMRAATLGTLQQAEVWA